jgi:hypothetical protein
VEPRGTVSLQHLFLLYFVLVRGKRFGVQAASDEVQNKREVFVSEPILPGGMLRSPQVLTMNTAGFVS